MAGGSHAAAAPGRRGLRFALLALAAAATAEALRAPHPAIAQAEEQLNAEMDKLLKASTEKIEASASKALKGQEAEIDKEFFGSKSEHKDALKGISEPSVAALADVKDLMAQAKAEAAMRGRSAAVNAARAEEARSEQLYLDLKKKAHTLETDGEMRRAQAISAQRETEHAIAEAKKWRDQWPKDKADDALRSSKLAQQYGTVALSAAQEATKSETLINEVGMQTLKVLTEVQDHATRASAVALRAIDQATQNAMRLKTIKGIVDSAQKQASESALGL